MTSSALQQSLLKRFIAQESEALLNTLRYYVLKAGLADNNQAKEIALELQSEVTVEALAHAQRFDINRQPRAWLLGIAANLIKRRQREQLKRHSREPLAGDLYDEAQSRLSDEVLFEHLMALSVDGPDHAVEAAAQAEAILQLLPEAQQLILRLAILQGMRGDALAEALSTTPGTARVRLHRALNQLRQAWLAHQQSQPSEVQEDSYE